MKRVNLFVILTVMASFAISFSQSSEQDEAASIVVNGTFASLDCVSGLEVACYHLSVLWSTPLFYYPSDVDSSSVPPTAGLANVSINGRTVELTIREDVRFDNGQPFTAEVAASILNRAISMETIISPLSISSIVPLVENVLTIQIADGANVIDTLLRLSWVPMVLESGDQFLGTGPFSAVLRSVEGDNQELRLKNNPSYSGFPTIPSVPSVLPDSVSFVSDQYDGCPNCFPFGCPTIFCGGGSSGSNDFDALIYFRRLTFFPL